jgi:hypothetical protein
MPLIRSFSLCAPDTRAMTTRPGVLNSCLPSRAELRAALDDAGMAGRMALPADGGYLDFAEHERAGAT